jgi:hypothetical protein
MIFGYAMHVPGASLPKFQKGVRGASTLRLRGWNVALSTFYVAGWI